MACIPFAFQKQFLDILKNAASSEEVWCFSQEADDFEDFKRRVAKWILENSTWNPPCRTNGKRGGTPDYMGFDDEMKQVIKSKRASKGKKSKKSKPTDSFKKAFGPRALGRGLSKQKTKIPGFQVQSKTKSGAILVPPIDYEKIAKCLKAEKPLSLETITLTGDALNSWPLKDANLGDVPIGYWASLSPVDESDFDTQSLRSKATKKYIPIKQLTEAQAYCFNFELVKPDDDADVLAQLAEKKPVVEHKEEEPVVEKQKPQVKFAEDTKSHDGKLATSEQFIDAIKLFCKEEISEDREKWIAGYTKRFRKHEAEKKTIAEILERKHFRKMKPYLEKIQREEDNDGFTTGEESDDLTFSDDEV